MNYPYLTLPCISPHSLVLSSLSGRGAVPRIPISVTWILHHLLRSDRLPNSSVVCLFIFPFVLWFFYFYGRLYLAYWHRMKLNLLEIIYWQKETKVGWKSELLIILSIKGVTIAWVLPQYVVPLPLRCHQVRWGLTLIFKSLCYFLNTRNGS